MTSDERFDQLLRSALDWQAERAVARQPSLRQATRQLAQRIGSSSQATVRPRLVLAPSPLGSLNLVTILLLLLALLGVALYVGAQLLKPPSFAPPERLGFAAECAIQTNTGLAFDEPLTPVVLTFTADDGSDSDVELDLHSLYADGRLVQDISVPGETRADNVTGSQIAVRRLAPHGVDLMLERVSDAGLTPGCRFLRTQESSGQLTAVTEEGATEVSWGPGSLSTSYVVSEDEEAQLGELTADLAHPEEWLPEDAWIDSTESRIRPDHWLIYLVLRPTDHLPGDEVSLTDGNVLSGSDPRYGSVAMPTGSDPLTFGVELPLADVQGPGSTVRCAGASREEAVSLATSLESLANGPGLGTDGEGELFTEDLTRSISFRIQPVFGAGYDCAALAETWQMLTQPRPTSSPQPPAGDMATVDPCVLVGTDAQAILGADDLQTRRSRLPVGVPANACVVSDSAVVNEFPIGVVDPLPAGYRAIVTLYPESVGSGAAQAIVDAVFGAGSIEAPIGGHPGWANPCLSAPDLPCTDTIAAWSRSHLLFFEFTNAATPLETQGPSGWSMTWEPLVSPEIARSFVEAVVVDLQE